MPVFTWHFLTFYFTFFSQFILPGGCVGICRFGSDFGYFFSFLLYLLGRLLRIVAKLLGGRQLVLIVPAFVWKLLLACRIRILDP